MLSVLRHAVAILLLPIVATVLVPVLLLRSALPQPGSGAATGWVVWIARTGGSAVLLAGLALFCWCVSLFARVGRGTLAPWDPTRKLVDAGPYRFVRNPMITGVALILVGEALFFLSVPLGVWVCVFVILNHLFFLFVEEPRLERRFGDAYRRYKATVPRWIPGVRRRSVE